MFAWSCWTHLYLNLPNFDGYLLVPYLSISTIIETEVLKYKNNSWQLDKYSLEKTVSSWISFTVSTSCETSQKEFPVELMRKYWKKKTYTKIPILQTQIYRWRFQTMVFYCSSFHILELRNSNINEIITQMDTRSDANEKLINIIIIDKHNF